MNAKELIEQLHKMPPDVEVWHLWDGAARTQIEHVWLAKGGHVVTADCREPCYNNEDLPLSVPLCDDERYWWTPATKNGCEQKSLDPMM